MKKIIALLFISLGLGWGCQKKNDTNPAASISSCLLTQEMADGNKTVYQYDSKKNLIDVVTTTQSGSTTETKAIEFNTAGLPTKLSVISPGKTIYRIIEYTGTQVIKSTDADANGNPTGNIYDYHYNSAGQMDSLRLTFNSTTAVENLLYDAQGNLNRSNIYFNGTLYSYNLFEYDSKKSAYSNFNLNTTIIFQIGGGSGSHNILKVTDYQGTAQGTVTTYSYTYDSNNLPSSCTAVTGGTGSTKNYTYDCH